MEAIVLAGGFGTRLAGIVKDMPKPMAPVAGRPFLEYILDDLASQGVHRVILAVCYMRECIMDHFGTNHRGMELYYSIEKNPLFTGGAIKQALRLCHSQRVFIINGDTFFQVDLKGMEAFSERKNSPFVIAVKKMTAFSRYGSVDVDEEGNITAFREKCFCSKGYINGGVYNLDRTALDGYPEKFSIENDCFPSAVKEKLISAIPSEGLFIDIGIPEDYERAQQIFRGNAQ